MVSPTDEEGVKDLDTHASAAPASAALQCTATAARPSSDALGRSGSERQLRTRRVAIIGVGQSHRITPRYARPRGRSRNTSWVTRRTG
jgi:hypothetical protein